MLRIFLRCFFATLALGAMFLGASSRAESLPIEAFYGRYVGAGFTFGDTGYFELKSRDMDVEIGPDNNGFFVAWTTVFRRPSEKSATHKSARVSFIPSERPGIYIERTAAGHVGNGLSWATVNGQMLTVHALRIDPDGSYVVQRYDRILFEKGMMMQFRSDRDGETSRLISGKLTKVK